MCNCTSKLGLRAAEWRVLLLKTEIPKKKIPTKKKDQLALAQFSGLSPPANRPDPDGPGGLGAEESGTERTGSTQ
jgi:hypothetical protein